MKHLIYEEIGDCHACQAEQVPVREYEHGVGAQQYYDEKKWKLCFICSSSFISTSVEYHKKDADIMQAIGFCTNLILHAIQNASSTK